MDAEQMELAYRTAVPIDDVDYLHISPTEGFAVVWIDTSDRPDLATLSAKEPLPEGYSVLTWFYHAPGKRSLQICLRVEMKTPVQYAFSLIFPVARYVDQLSRIAQQGKIWIVSGPPPDHLRGKITMTPADFMQQVIAYAGMGLLISLQEHLVQELRHQLTEWKRGK